MTYTNLCHVCLTPRVGKQTKSSKIHLNQVSPGVFVRGKHGLIWLAFLGRTATTENKKKLEGEGCNNMKQKPGQL